MEEYASGKYGRNMKVDSVDQVRATYIIIQYFKQEKQVMIASVDRFNYFRRDL